MDSYVEALQALVIMARNAAINAVASEHAMGLQVAMRLGAEEPLLVDGGYVDGEWGNFTLFDDDETGFDDPDSGFGP